jgi:hypothetical protein
LFFPLRRLAKPRIHLYGGGRIIGGDIVEDVSAVLFRRPLKCGK